MTVLKPYYKISKSGFQPEWNLLETTISEKYLSILLSVVKVETTHEINDRVVMEAHIEQLVHTGVYFNQAFDIFFRPDYQNKITDLVKVMKQIVLLVPSLDFIKEAKTFSLSTTEFKSNISLIMNNFIALVLKMYKMGNVVGRFESTEYIAGNNNKTSLDYILEFLTDNKSLRLVGISNLVIQGSDSKRISRALRVLNNTSSSPISFLISQCGLSPREALKDMIDCVQGETLLTLNYIFATNLAPASLVSIDNSNNNNGKIHRTLEFEFMLALGALSKIFDNRLPNKRVMPTGAIVTYSKPMSTIRDFSIHCCTDDEGDLVYHLIGNLFNGAIDVSNKSVRPSISLSIHVNNIFLTLSSLTSMAQIELFLSFLHWAGLLDESFNLMIEYIKSPKEKIFNSRNQLIKLINSIRDLYDPEKNDYTLTISEYNSLAEVLAVVQEGKTEEVEDALKNAGKEGFVTINHSFNFSGSSENIYSVSIVEEDFVGGKEMTPQQLDSVVAMLNIIIPDGYKLIYNIGYTKQMTRDEISKWSESVPRFKESKIVLEEGPLELSSEEFNMESLVLLVIKSDTGFDSNGLKAVNKFIDINLFGASQENDEDKSKSKKKKKKAG